MKNVSSPDQALSAGGAWTAPLNPVEVETIHLFVQFSRALGHPCKIYNILAVGAPVIYIGPRPSHITEILDRLGAEYPSARVAHGEADILANQIQVLRRSGVATKRQLPMETLSAFSQAWLLPRMAALIGGSGETG